MNPLFGFPTRHAEAMALAVAFLAILFVLWSTPTSFAAKPARVTRQLPIGRPDAVCYARRFNSWNPYP